ncbi:MAG: helix-turn-helix domain-containing protein [Lachnospiraceae bacterium]|nr:helix-turn-helix domain-containing protein [Lachnospiraceae bacterium]
MKDLNVALMLKKMRKESGFSSSDVVAALERKGINIAIKTLYGYENGVSMPNADIFMELCAIYNCTNPLDCAADVPDIGQRLLVLFNRLNEEGQERIIEELEMMVESKRYIKSREVGVVSKEIL